MVIGDEFVRKTAKNHFLHTRRPDTFAIKHYEVNVITGDTADKNNNFFTGRICNAMVHLFNKSVNMPKIVAIVLEDDLINHIGDQGIGTTEHYAVYIEDIIKDFKRISEKFKAILPDSATRVNWPKLVFIVPTLHRNYDNYGQRKIFNEVLEAVTKEHEKICWSLKLLQIWDENDCQLFLKREQRFTREGLNNLWYAIDKTFAFCNRKMFREEARNSPSLGKRKYGQSTTEQ